MGSLDEQVLNGRAVMRTDQPVRILARAVPAHLEVARDLAIGVTLARCDDGVEQAAQEAALSQNSSPVGSDLAWEALEGNIIRHGFISEFDDPGRFRFCCCTRDKMGH